MFQGSCIALAVWWIFYIICRSIVVYQKRQIKKEFEN